MKQLVGSILMGICMTVACSSSMPGAAPGLTLSASSLMFGQEVVGQPSSAEPVTLRNTGTGDAANHERCRQRKFSGNQRLWRKPGGGCQLHDQRDLHTQDFGQCGRTDYVDRQCRGQPTLGAVIGNRKRQRTALYAEGNAVPGTVSAVLSGSELCARVHSGVLRVDFGEQPSVSRGNPGSKGSGGQVYGTEGRG